MMYMYGDLAENGSMRKPIDAYLTPAMRTSKTSTGEHLSSWSLVFINTSMTYQNIVAVLEINYIVLIHKGFPVGHIGISNTEDKLVIRQYLR